MDFLHKNLGSEPNPRPPGQTTTRRPRPELGGKGSQQSYRKRAGTHQVVFRCFQDSAFAGSNLEPRLGPTTAPCSAKRWGAASPAPKVGFVLRVGWSIGGCGTLGSSPNTRQHDLVQHGASERARRAFPPTSAALEASMGFHLRSHARVMNCICGGSSQLWVHLVHMFEEAIHERQRYYQALSGLFVGLSCLC